MQERVQKILASRGVASRRQAEQLIIQGRVTVNGKLCQIGDTADGEQDQILVDGVPLSAPPKPVYILLNKPRGYVTTAADEKGRKTVLELVDCGCRVYPVGRLDMDSEGLLLLTNDGDLTNRLLHPSHQVEKSYLVWLRGAASRKIQNLERPMDIDGYRIRPAQVELLWLDRDQANVQITIHEGRNRQIRKMAEQCGMQVTRLRRVSEGPIQLGQLPKGQWRYLTENELQQLLKL
jgi:23S rRNA pseudouridine2605 synthase